MKFFSVLCLCILPYTYESCQNQNEFIFGKSYPKLINRIRLLRCHECVLDKSAFAKLCQNHSIAQKSSQAYIESI
jgi:hypothetical protein